MSADEVSSLQADEENEGRTRRSRKPLLLSLVIAVVLVAGYLLYPPLQQQIDTAWFALRSGERQRISDWVDQFGPWGPAAVILAMTAQMFLIVVPSVVLMVVAVVAYGPLWGTLLACAAVLFASAVGYGVGRMVGADTLRRWIGGAKVDRFCAYVDHYGLWGIVVFRLSPFLSNDAISLVAGVFEMRVLRFLMATLVGITPLAIAIGWAGRHTAQMEYIFGGISVVGLMLLVAFVVFDRRRRGQS